MFDLKEDYEALLGALKKAFNTLQYPEKLQYNDLASLPIIYGKWLDGKTGCGNCSAGMRLKRTIAYFIEERIKDSERRDYVWQGCVILWLHRIYPAFLSQSTDKILYDIFWKKGADLIEDPVGQEQIFNNALLDISVKLLGGRQLSSIYGETPSKATVAKRLDTARRWLLDQLLGYPKFLLVRLARSLHDLYSYSPIPGLPDTEAFFFKDASIVPKLWDETRQSYRTVGDVLAKEKGGIYIYGAPASGKTVMSRFVVWRLAQEYFPKTTDGKDQSNQETNDKERRRKKTGNRKTVEEQSSAEPDYPKPNLNFPLPLNCRLFPPYTSEQDKGLPALAAGQWQVELAKKEIFTEDTLRALPALLSSDNLRPVPVVDDFDSLRLEKSLQIWRLPIEKELHSYAQYLVFSRHLIPDLEFDASHIKFYRLADLAETNSRQRENFIEQWAERRKTFKWGTMWAHLQNADRSIQRLARTPLGLAQLCLYFENNRSLPKTPVQLMRKITNLILSNERRLLPLRDAGVWQIVDVLGEVALYAYVDPSAGKPRANVLNKINVRRVRRFLENEATRNLFEQLCKTQFLAEQGQNEDGDTLVAFPADLYRDYYAAERLFALRDDGRKIVEQGIHIEGWQQLRDFYVALDAED